jgi:hypothetical protein
MEDQNLYVALSGLSDDLSRLATAIAPHLVSIEAGRRRSATGTVWRDGVVALPRTRSAIPSICR